MGEEQNKQKALMDLISIEVGNIADMKKLNELNIDTIVNAANPTLMGSDQGVDMAIHNVINIRNGKRDFFKERICKELNMGPEARQIRCRRGDAVLTQGYDLCRYVIHAVGAEYDGAEHDEKGRKSDACSSSMIHILESCYERIVELIMMHADIKRVAIPVIGSGHYKVPFQTAFQIAVASLYNALLEWKRRDPEIFELSAPDHIYFFIYDKITAVQKHNKIAGDEILSRYQTIMKKENRIVFQTSTEAHFRCLREIQKYDNQRGYFSVARWVRLLVMRIRTVFFPFMKLKDLVGGEDWSKRRRFVEWFAFGKAGLPIAACLLSTRCVGCECPIIQAIPFIFTLLIIYCMSDTITYLLALILLADIQGPSANVTRSLVLLLVNFVEVSLEMTYLYLIYCGNDISLREAAEFGILGVMGQDWRNVANEAFRYVNSIIRFFFLTIAFGYISGHMHQKTFRS